MGALEGWEQRLRAVVEDWAAAGFCWGSRDCLGFCIATRTAITGEEWKLPAYRTEAGAARQLRKLGYRTVEDYVSAHLDPVPVSAARRGDWVMQAGMPRPLPGSFGVVLGRTAAFMSENGLVWLQALSSQYAWRAT